MIRIAGLLAAAAALSGCTGGLRYATETEWPGSGHGRVESRIDQGPSRLTESGAGAPVVVGGAVLGQVDSGAWLRTPALSHYEVRSPDGTLHIISSERAFPEGSCVAWTGYADSPARTHWSWGRVELTASDQCVP